MSSVFFSIGFDQILFILTCNNDKHESLDDFDCFVA